MKSFIKNILLETNEAKTNEAKTEGGYGINLTQKILILYPLLVKSHMKNLVDELEANNIKCYDISNIYKHADKNKHMDIISILPNLDVYFLEIIDKDIRIYSDLGVFVATFKNVYIPIFSQQISDVGFMMKMDYVEFDSSFINAMGIYDIDFTKKNINSKISSTNYARQILINILLNNKLDTFEEHMKNSVLPESTYTIDLSDKDWLFITISKIKALVSK